MRRGRNAMRGLCLFVLGLALGLPLTVPAAALAAEAPKQEDQTPAEEPVRATAPANPRDSAPFPGPVVAQPRLPAGQAQKPQGQAPDKPQGQGQPPAKTGRTVYGDIIIHK